MAVCGTGLIGDVAMTNVERTKVLGDLLAELIARGRPHRILVQTLPGYS